MRINTVEPSIVRRPDEGAQPGGVSAVNRIGAQPAGSPEGQARPIRTRSIATIAPEPAGERRQFSRRGDDRRKKQLPVLIDTRVDQRRTNRRRGEDEAPPSVDIQA
jgi:hypothetical protein